MTRLSVLEDGSGFGLGVETRLVEWNTGNEEQGRKGIKEKTRNMKKRRKKE